MAVLYLWSGGSCLSGLANLLMNYQIMILEINKNCCIIKYVHHS